MIFCIDSLSSLREENMIQMACAVNFSLKRRMTTRLLRSPFRSRSVKTGPCAHGG